MLRTKTARSESELISLHEGRLDKGLRLAENRDRILYISESRRRKSPTIRMGDIMEAIDGLSDEMKAHVALMCENTRQFFDSLDEATLTTHIGEFERWAFPIIGIVYPNLVAHDMVSVQPMDAEISMIVFMKAIYGATKGTATAGADMFENPSPKYNSEEVDVEYVGAAGAANYTGNLDWTPVRPGTITITSDTQIVKDDGQGNFTGDVNPAGNNTINYTTGAYDFTFAAAAAAEVDANYEYVMEGSENRPEVEYTFVTTPVTAKERSLKTNISMRALQRAKAMYGQQIDVELAAVVGSDLKWGTDREVIDDLFSIAIEDSTAAYSVPQFSTARPTGVSLAEHYLSFTHCMTASRNVVLDRTQRAVPNFMVCGINVLNVLQTLGNFQGGQKWEGRGVSYVGDWLGMRVYADAYIDRDRYMFGHKGDSMLRTGYVLGSYIPFYTTPDVILPDMNVKRAAASLYAKKIVDERFYVKGRITHT